MSWGGDGVGCRLGLIEEPHPCLDLLSHACIGSIKLGGASHSRQNEQIQVLGKWRAEPQLFHHFLHGTGAWTQVAGGLTRLRARAGATVFSALLLGTPWWLPQDWMDWLDETVDWTIRYILVVLILVGLALFWAGSLYLQRRSIRSLRLKGELHRFTHVLRDHYTAAQTLQPILIRQISDEMCNRVHEYFRVLHQREDLSVAIRLARSEGYRTMGRCGLSLGRRDHSQAIRPDEGVAKLLADRGYKGVIYYPDIHLAAEKGGTDVRVRTENDRNYREEVRSQMVAPINGWDGTLDNRHGMLGLLFLNCRDTGVFGPTDSDSLMFIADGLASLYAELATQGDKLLDQDGMDGNSYGT